MNKIPVQKANTVKLNRANKLCIPVQEASIVVRPNATHNIVYLPIKNENISLPVQKAKTVRLNNMHNIYIPIKSENVSVPVHKASNIRSNIVNNNVYIPIKNENDCVPFQKVKSIQSITMQNNVSVPINNFPCTNMNKNKVMQNVTILNQKANDRTFVLLVEKNILILTYYL